MKKVVLALAALLVLAVSQPAAAADPGPVHQCGTFVSYRPADATRSGQLVIGSTTYATSWMGSTGPAGSTPHRFNQVVASGATPGSQVCLDGTIAASQTEGNLLTDFTVAPAPTATTSPTFTAVPTSAPTTPTALPSTTAPPQTGMFGFGLVWGLLVLAVLAAVAFLIARSRRGAAAP